MKTNKTLVALAALGLLLANANAQSFLTNGLVAFYPFNGNANNLGGSNDFTGTIVGNVTLTANRFNKPNSAYQFFRSSGSDINFGNPTWLNGLTNATWSWWMATTNTPTSGWVSVIRKNNSWIPMQWAQDAAGVGNQYRGRFTTSAPDFVYPSGAVQADGTWMQFCMVYNGLTLTLYKNGSLIKSQAYAYGAIPTNTYAFLIGGSEAGNENFSGSVDDVRIYNRALSTNEVAQLYALESAAPPSLGIFTYSNAPVIFYPTASGTNYATAAGGTNFILQMATNLASPVWVTVTNAVPFSGFQVTNPPANAFFRLN
jgi:trimeric autotransporter adhesin